MTSDYENFINRVKADLADLPIKTKEDIVEAIKAMRSLYERRRNIKISDEDATKAAAELVHFYADIMTEDDSEVYNPIIRSTWWTDSLETRKK